MDTLNKYYLDVFANPSSLHKAGVEAEKAVSNSRKLIASLINAEEEQIIFTSGATEANNLIIANSAFKRAEPYMISSKIEHSSVKKSLNFYAGGNVHYLENDDNGIISDDFDLEELDKANFISLIMVNNEIATIQDIKNLVKQAKLKGFRGLFHTDATQAVGKIPVNVKDLDCDFLTASAHKFNAPKGVGFLYCKDLSKLKSMSIGGSQEFNKRAGTENVAGICAMAKALSKSCKNMTENIERVSKYKNKIVDYIKNSEYFDLTIDENVKQSPYILSIKSNLAPSEVLLHAYADMGIYISSGSACNSKNPAVSGVLDAINKAPTENTAVLRISFASDTIEEDIDAFILASDKVVERFVK